MKHILCYGDSNTFGHDPVAHGGRIPFEERWTGRLSMKLWPEARIIEEGLCSRTTIFDDPFHEDVNGLKGIGMAIRSAQPLDLVVIMLGTNDLKNYFHMPPSQIARGVGVLVDKVRSLTDAEILVVSPIRLGDNIAYSEFGGAFDDISLKKSGMLGYEIRKTAEAQHVHYLAAEDYAMPSEEDSLHMTAKEHGKLADALEVKIREILDLK